MLLEWSCCANSITECLELIPGPAKIESFENLVAQKVNPLSWSWVQVLGPVCRVRAQLA